MDGVDEELRASAVGAGVGHAQGEGFVGELEFSRSESKEIRMFSSLKTLDEQSSHKQNDMSSLSFLTSGRTIFASTEYHVLTLTVCSSGIDPS